MTSSSPASPPQTVVSQTGKRTELRRRRTATEPLGKRSAARRVLHTAVPASLRSRCRRDPTGRLLPEPN